MDRTQHLKETHHVDTFQSGHRSHHRSIHRHRLRPNSTVLMPLPIRLRSSTGSNSFSHSRTGAPPAAVRKKSAGTRLTEDDSPIFTAQNCTTYVTLDAAGLLQSDCA